MVFWCKLGGVFGGELVLGELNVESSDKNDMAPAHANKQKCVCSASLYFFRCSRVTAGCYVTGTIT